jgi:DNA-binding CsgD family transcriptional regulator
MLIMPSMPTRKCESMSILTEREREILRHLKDGESVMTIGRKLKTPVTSISRSITSIKRKAQDMEEDISFLQEIGYLSISKGQIFFTAPDRDPKSLAKRKQ